MKDNLKKDSDNPKIIINLNVNKNNQDQVSY